MNFVSVYSVYKGDEKLGNVSGEAYVEQAFWRDELRSILQKWSKSKEKNLRDLTNLFLKFPAEVTLDAAMRWVLAINQAKRNEAKLKEMVQEAWTRKSLRETLITSFTDQYIQALFAYFETAYSQAQSHMKDGSISKSEMITDMLKAMDIAAPNDATLRIFFERAKSKKKHT